MHKLGKFLRLLASDKPGEVVAAAGAIVRTLQAEGHDIHALADVVERSPLAPQKETESPQDKSSDWRTVRTWCAARQDLLTEREREFVTSLAHWRHPTERQLAWLQIIQSNIRRRQGQ
jgi:hypothetical protein